MREREANWLDLPDDILSVVSLKLHDTFDYIHFGAICHSWRWVYLQTPHPNSQQLPLLMFTTDTSTDYQSRSFYNLADETILPFKVPVPHNRCCCGCTYGWLVTVAPITRQVHLLNPFLSVNNEINLPPFTKFGSITGVRMPLHEFSITKAVLSVNPTTNPNYAVMVIYGAGFSSLAFIKPGDEAWTSLGSGKQWQRLFCDIIYYKNQFYAVNKSGEVYVINLDEPQPKLKKIAPEVHRFAWQKYLVDMAGELLQIAIKLDYDEDGEGYYFFNSFYIYKFDPVKVKWIKIRNLCGHSIFIGNNTSFSLLASDCPGCKPNFIYFTVDYEGYARCKDFEAGAHAWGICNVEDGSVEPLYPKASNKRNPPPIWVQPML